MKKALLSFAAALFGVLVFAAGTAGTVGTASAEAKKSGLEAFFGRYVGRSTMVVGEGLADRDFTVIVEPFKKKGFNLKWSTIIRYLDRAPKEKTHAVTFLPYRRRPGIYYSAVEKDVFGYATPTDPLSGEPYVWAALKDKTLTVSALYVTDTGGYELQVFKRTLDGNGLTSHFERIRDGKQARLIKGRLERVAE